MTSFSYINASFTCTCISKNLGPVSISNKTFRKDSRPRDLYLELHDCSEIWQAHRQQSADVFVRFQSDAIISTTTRVASILHEILRYDVLSDIGTGLLVTCWHDKSGHQQLCYGLVPCFSTRKGNFKRHRQSIAWNMLTIFNSMVHLSCRCKGVHVILLGSIFTIGTRAIVHEYIYQLLPMSPKQSCKIWVKLLGN